MALQGFDKDYYLSAKLTALQATYPEWSTKTTADLEVALTNAGFTAESHYQTYGWQEGLAPNAYFSQSEYVLAKANQLFNAGYAASVDAAKAAFEAAWTGDAYLHYLQYGAAENVNPSNSFDESSYIDDKLAALQADPDTAAEWAGKTSADLKAALLALGFTALTHFLAYGEAEGLTATPVPDAELPYVPPVAGQTFSLTQGLDTIEGTSGDDTINAYAFNTVTGADVTTLNSVDTIDGGAGTDTLNIEVKDNGAGGDYNDTIQGTISNVEIVNINNTAALSAAAVDATTLGTAAQQIWQIGQAANVTKLAATTTAGLKNITVGGQVISAADNAASATVALDNVDESLTFIINSTTVAGVLNTVSVSGTVKDLNADGVTNTVLAVVAGKDVQAVTVDSDVTTTLTVANAAGSTKAINAVDLSGSTAGVTYTTADNKVATINGGAGNDSLTNIFAGTATANAATLSGGAGDDILTFNATQGAATALTANVNGGEGKDTINLTINTGVTYTVAGGAGDDTIAISGAVKTTDSIDGGDGTDTVSVAGSAARIADDYIILNKVLQNFESLKFSSAEGAGTDLDASLLAANYTTLDFFTGSFVDNVGTQALISRGALTAEAEGYVNIGEGTPAATAIGYAGTLNITDKGLLGAADAIQARAEIVNLTVEGGKANGVTANDAVLTGEAKTITVTLSAGIDTKGTADTTDDTFVASSVTVQQLPTALGATPDEFKDLASLTLSGNGSATVTIGDVGTPTNAAHKLVMVDASGLNSVDENGDAVTGLTYTSVNTAAETVKLGGGIDTITLGASTYGKMDTVEGLNLVVSGGALTAASDTITITGNAGLVANGKMTTTQTDLDLALLDAAKFQVGGVDVDTLAFHLGGNTYFYQDNNGDNLVDVADTVVKLTGLIDLDALVIAL